MTDDDTEKRLRLGTRGSALALAQSGMIARAIEERARALGAPLRVDLVEITTKGDVDGSPLVALGGSGVFVARLRTALLRGDCDLAVHSCKDLPSGEVEGLTLAALPAREDPRDVLCSRSRSPLGGLPAGARIGTGSPRRSAAIRAARPDLDIVEIRGNVPTRLARLERDLDAVVLAAAGLIRLGLAERIDEFLDPGTMLPAPAQGALALETRADADPSLLSLLAGLDDPATRLAVTAERSLMNALEAGCAAPVGALASLEGHDLRLEAGVWSIDGRESIRLRERADAAQGVEGARRLGERLARSLLGAGAGAITDLHAAKNPHPTDAQLPRPAQTPGAPRERGPALPKEHGEGLRDTGEPRPRVLLTRASSPDDPDPFARAIDALGLTAVPVRLTRTAVDEAECARALEEMSRLQGGAILFTSKRTLSVLSAHSAHGFASLLASAHERGVRIGAVGEATGRELALLGTAPDLVAEGSGAALAAALGAAPGGEDSKVLLARSASGDPALPAALADAGWKILEGRVYDTVPLEEAPEEAASAWADPDLLAAVITAPSALRAILALLGPAHPRTPLIALGRTSAAAFSALAPDSPVLSASAPTPDAVAAILSTLLDIRLQEHA